MADKVAVLLAAGAEAWETSALRLLSSGGTVVLKRCVDLTDLLASAATGQAHVAVVAGVLPGLDADAVTHLLGDEVRCVAVGGDAASLHRMGVVAVVPEPELGSLPDAVAAAGTQQVAADPVRTPEPAPATRMAGGSVIAVHGPAGSPGRTTLAIGLAAEHARRGSASVLVDADPYGGAVAQQLGVLDEVSGLLAAARLVNAGSLDAAGLARCRRRVADGLDLLTGLPRPDRWVEARPGVLASVLGLAREVGDVVVDTGFSLEADTDPGRTASRNQLTIDALAAADQVVVVGTAEPTGLARLARTLVDLRETTVDEVPLTVVVNRMRDSLGWSRRDVVGMVEGYSRPAGVHFLPEDRSTTDRALVAGKSVSELGDSALRRGLAEVHDAVFTMTRSSPGAGLRSHPSAGRARWRCRRP